MRALHLGDRRFVAVGVLAIASLLEVCGCNPLPDCGRVDASGIASTGWAAVLDRCANCFSNDAAGTTRQDTRRPPRRGASGPLERGKPLQPALLRTEGPYFYDPDPDPSAEDASNHDWPPLKPVLSLDDKPRPWTIPESVFFVYKTIVTGDGKAHRTPSATAFVISVPDFSHRTTVRFLVTARHVVDPKWAHCSENNPRSIDVRFNRRNGGVGYETISLQNDRLAVFLAPSDETSDIAVIRLDQRLIPNLESYKFFDTPFRLLPTDSELQTVRSDQQIMTASLTRSLPETSVYPVSHGGVLSGNSTEAVTMLCGAAQGSTQLHVWFINAAIPQGVSGAPVFTSMSREAGGLETPVLLGIQAIAWPDRGIAGMTPSPVLSDLIHQALRGGKERMDFSKGDTP